jgi:hypothetical protein
LILDHVVIPLELGELSYSPQRTFEDMLGQRGRKRLGHKKWEEAVETITAILRMGFVTDYVVIGGGNARRLSHLPKGARLGDNRNAFAGGLRLWGLSQRKSVGKAQPFIIR